MDIYPDPISKSGIGYISYPDPYPYPYYSVNFCFKKYQHSFPLNAIIYPSKIVISKMRVIDIDIDEIFYS